MTPRKSESRNLIRAAILLETRAEGTARNVFRAIVSTDFERVFCWGDKEILVHSKSAIDLTRLEAGVVPLQEGHYSDKIIGMAVPGSCEIRDGKLSCDIKIAEDGGLGSEMIERWHQGVARNLSIGYRWLEYTEKRAEKGCLTHTVTKWALNEISIVGVPADLEAIVTTNTTRERIETMKNQIRSEGGAPPIEQAADPAITSPPVDQQRSDAPEAALETAAPEQPATAAAPVDKQRGDPAPQTIPAAPRSFDDRLGQIRDSIKSATEQAASLSSVPEANVRAALADLQSDEIARLRHDGAAGFRTDSERTADVFGIFASGKDSRSFRSGDGLVERKSNGTANGAEKFRDGADVMDAALFVRHADFVKDERHGSFGMKNGPQAATRGLERGMSKLLVGGGSGIGDADKDLYSAYVRALKDDLPDFQRTLIENGQGYPIPLSTLVRARAYSFAEGIRAFPEMKDVAEKLRQFSVTLDSGGKGGNLVDTMIDYNLITSPYYSGWMFQMLGLTQRMGLVSNLQIPRVTGKFTPTFLAEGAAVADTDVTIGKVTLTPKRLAVLANTTNILDIQTHGRSGDIIVGELMVAMDSIAMNAMLNGSGTGAEPRGLLQTSGIGMLEFNALSAVTKGNVVDMQYAPQEANAPMGSKMLLATAFAKKLASTGRSSGGGDGFLLEGMRLDDAIDVMTTTQISFADGEPMGLFALWDQVVLAHWGTPMLRFDPYTRMQNSEVRICLETYMDIGVRNLAALTRFNEMS